MSNDTVLKIDKALTLHINYSGKSSGGRYLRIMDALAVGYPGPKGLKVSALLDDYFKEVGVKNLQEAIKRVRKERGLK